MLSQACSRHPRRWSILLVGLIITNLSISAGASTGFHKRPTFAHSKASDQASVDSKNSNTSSSTSTDNLANVTNIPAWKQALPSPLNTKSSKTLQRIIIPGPGNDNKVEVFLLGTAHVSKDSSRDVRLLLDHVQPNVVFLELCDQRIPMMVTPPVQQEEESIHNNNTVPTTTTNTTRVAARWKFWKRQRSKPKQRTPNPQGQSMYGRAASLLTNMQEDYADSLGVELGGEFRMAYDYWNDHRQNGRLHLILGDRPLYLTLTRAWESLRWWGKTKLMIGLLMSSLQKPNPEELKEWMENILKGDADLLTESIAELAQHFPTLERVIIQERDAYMACKLYQTARQLMSISPSDATTHRLVVIVGAGHVDGMCEWLTGGRGNELPEVVLSRLIAIRKSIPVEEQRALVHDVMEVNYEMLQELTKEMVIAEQES